MIKLKLATKKLTNNFLINFNLAKFGAALCTIIIIALVKYLISGDFHISYTEFWNNVGIGLLGWTVNTSIFGWLSEFLGIKGINFNLRQFIYGFHTIGVNNDYSYESKTKLYNAMESNDESGTNIPLDKGKDVEMDYSESGNNETDSTDKGKGIDRTIHPFYEGTNLEQSKEPPFAVWSRVFPGLDPASVFFPKTINPGPGFNVPGGEVPLHDEICKHIEYNSHILNQFKKMDLKTAIQQRDNYLKYIQIMDSKSAYAKDVLSKIPTIPTTEHEFKLKKQILRDLDNLSKDRIKAEAKATLLNSRIEFIEIHKKPNE